MPFGGHSFAGDLSFEGSPTFPSFSFSFLAAKAPSRPAVSVALFCPWGGRGRRAPPFLGWRRAIQKPGDSQERDPLSVCG